MPVHRPRQNKSLSAKVRTLRLQTIARMLMMRYECQQYQQLSLPYLHLTLSGGGVHPTCCLLTDPPCGRRFALVFVST